VINAMQNTPNERQVDQQGEGLQQS